MDIGGIFCGRRLEVRVERLEFREMKRNPFRNQLCFIDGSAEANGYSLGFGIYYRIRI